MIIEPEISGSSIVLLGQFNPSIFHPTWLQSNGIEVGDEWKVEIVHPDISRFRFGDRFYTVDQNRFQVQTTVAPWVALLDITFMIFGEFLVHTPVRALGVNRDSHFCVKDEDTRLKIGRTLAPIGAWGNFGKKMEPGDGWVVGGLQSLTMRSIFETERFSKQVNAKIEPSGHILSNNGIYMQVNSHFTLLGLADGHGAGDAVAVLSDMFQESLNEADEIIDNIMSACRQ